MILNEKHKEIFSFCDSRQGNTNNAFFRSLGSQFYVQFRVGEFEIIDVHVSFISKYTHYPVKRFSLQHRQQSSNFNLYPVSNMPLSCPTNATTTTTLEKTTKTSTPTATLD